jgi:hypothetical protein
MVVFLVQIRSRISERVHSQEGFCDTRRRYGTGVYIYPTAQAAWMHMEWTECVFTSSETRKLAKGCCHEARAA